MGSTRLRGKVLMKIGPWTLLEHILLRLRRLRHDVRTVIATSTSPADDAVQAFCDERAIECFRGSESDVLERYYLCAEHYGFDQIVRLTGDNPLVDVEELDRLIDRHVTTGADYSYSFDDLPKGVGAEIMTFQALAASHRQGTEPHHREHVNEYILEHPGTFRMERLDIPAGKRRPDISLTIDTPEDLARMQSLLRRAGDEFITTEKAIELCSRSA